MCADSPLAPAEAGDDPAFRRAARRIVTQTAALLRAGGLYDADNQVFLQPSIELEREIGGLFGIDNAFSLRGARDELFINNKLVRPDASTFTACRAVLKLLEEKQIGGLSFASPAPASDLRQLAVTIARFAPRADPAVPPEVQLGERLKQGGWHAITVLKQADRATDEKEVDVRVQKRRRALGSYQNAVELVRSTLTAPQGEVRLDTKRAQHIVREMVELAESADENFVFVGLTAIRNHDEYTFTHVVNVCIYAIYFGMKLGLSRRHLSDLGIAALYHDYGKVDVPLTVLNKVGKFSDEEWRLMRNHVLFGVPHMLDDLGLTETGFRRLLVAMQHHQTLDGGGYPVVRIRKLPHLFSRIMAIVDSYDAMTTNRVYQRALGQDQAMKILLAAAGKRHDATLVKAFVNAMGVFPVASLVQLSDNRLGIVCEVPPERERMPLPKVKLCRAPDGAVLDGETLDLSSPAAGGVRIVRCIDPEPLGINVTHYLV